MTAILSGLTQPPSLFTLYTLYAHNLIIVSRDELRALRYPAAHDLLVLARSTGARHLDAASAPGSIRVRSGDRRSHHQHHSECRQAVTPAVATGGGKSAPKARKLERDPLLLAKVNAGLRQKWSPQQIATRFRADFPDEEAMRGSHEAIYQALFVPAQGQLKTQLIGRLRTGRVRRVSPAERRAVLARPQAIPDILMITERPTEVADRGRPRPLGG